MHTLPSIAQENRKVSWKDADVLAYWKHWREHIPITHPAAELGEHIPIGIFGDDAKYTMAGAKVIVMLLNIVVQNTMRFSIYLNVFFFHYCNLKNWGTKGLNLKGYPKLNDIHL